MISILLMKQIAQMFLMILMGYVLVKLKLLKSEDSKALSVIILYLVTPCVIINSFQVDYTLETRNALILSFAIALFIHIILILVDKILGGIFKFNAIEKTSNIYSNSGNLIIPLVAAILGEEWVLYSCGFMSVQLIFFWTHCKMIISEEKSVDIKKILTNVNIICIAFGIILFVTGIRLPELVNDTLGSVSKLIAPLAMFVSGMLMANVKLKEIFTRARVYVIVLMRMIIYPLIVLAFLKLSHAQYLVPEGHTILMISFLATVAPAASTVTQMALVYGNDFDYANKINIFTILVSIVTMPLMIMVYEMVM